MGTKLSNQRKHKAKNNRKLRYKRKWKNLGNWPRPWRNDWDFIKKTNLLTAFEIDLKYSEILNEKFGKLKNFKLIKGDFLKKYKNENQNIDKIFSNLPYNIASKVISKLIEENFLKEMVFTVQKELADRITAKINSKNYSSFTVLVQSHFKVIKILDIGENNFYPAPKVKSTTLKLIPKKTT